MKIKKVIAKKVRDSRGKTTIQVIVKTGFFKGFKTSAPSGKSTGKYEVNSYSNTIEEDIGYLNNFELNKLNSLNLEKFEDLLKIDNLMENAVGGNTLFAFEASLLKALAKENKQELYEFLGGNQNIKIPTPVGNAVGGGLHSKGIRNKKPDFQEFLFISDIETNELAYKAVGKLLKVKKTNDEGAWETDKTNEEILKIMKQVVDVLEEQGKKIKIGLDIAASSFYKNGKYYYKNKRKILNKPQQISHIKKLIKKYGIYYAEDVLEENDFKGFAEINKLNGFIVGDDLTTTNPNRFKRAIGMKSINAIIVKPNQIGSLIKTKQVIDLAKQDNIKTIISHRSGETMDNTIADLGVAWGCDFIKTGINGKVRKAKLNRLVEIEKKTQK